jgi:hypothetical protein
MAIHAAKCWEPHQRRFAELERAAKRLPWGNLPFGAIVAVVEIFDVRPTDQLLFEGISEVERAWGDYSPGRFGWLFTNVRPLREPVKCSGQQGMWTLDEETTAAVFANIDQARAA